MRRGKAKGAHKGDAIGGGRKPPKRCPPARGEGLCRAKTTEIAFTNGESAKGDGKMNTQKWRTGNLGLLSEADRTMYKDKDTTSKSIIDKGRTADNYNVCPHPQYTAAQVKDTNRKIRGKEIAKNAIAWGSTIITLPKDYTGDAKAFFQAAYEGMKRMYGLKDEDIISAYVHMDETTPHMHFYFVPVVHAEKDRINWNGVMPRAMYKTQHKVLQKYMQEQLGVPVTLLNGETKGVDVQGLAAEQKKASMELERTQKKTQYEKDTLETVQMAAEEERAALASLKAQNTAERKKAEEIHKPYEEAMERLHEAIQHLLGQIMALKPGEREREKDLFAAIERYGRKHGPFGRKSPEEINRAAGFFERESSRIESENSAEPDDDFGMR